MKSIRLLSFHFAASIAFASACAFAIGANDPYAFFSFDTQTNGNGEFTTSVTSFSGFSAAPTLVYSGAKIDNTGGATTFLDPTGTVWQGSGKASTPGHSLAWSEPSGTDSSNLLSLTLNTSNLENIKIRFDIRSATSTALIRDSFLSFTYSVAGGEAVSIPGSLNFQTGGNSFYEWTVDLSSIVAINNQSTVTLTWTIPSLKNGYGSVRIDNLLITATTAIPESAAWASFIGAAGLAGTLLIRRLSRG